MATVKVMRLGRQVGTLLVSPRINPAQRGTLKLIPPAALKADAIILYLETITTNDGWTTERVCDASLVDEELLRKILNSAVSVL